MRLTNSFNIHNSLQMTSVNGGLSVVLLHRSRTVVFMVVVLLFGPVLSGSSVQAGVEGINLQEWLLEDAWIRLDSGDYGGAADAFQWAMAFDPGNEELWQFPIGRLPLGLAGSVMVDMIQVLEQEAATKECGVMLRQWMLGYLHYGLFASAAGHMQRVEEAALAIENIYYAFFHVDDLDFPLMQAAPAMLRSLAAAQTEAESTLWQLRAQQTNIEASWWFLEICLLRYPDYWAPLLRHEDWAEIPSADISYALEWYPEPAEYDGAFPDLEGQFHNGLLPAWDVVLEELDGLDYDHARELLLGTMFDAFAHWQDSRSYEDFEETLLLAAVLTQWDPQCFEAWFVTAQLLAELKDDPKSLEAATDALIQTLDLVPDFLEAQLLLAQVLMEQGRFYSATDQYKFIIERFGEELITGLVTAPLALAYVADGRTVAGIIYFEKLLADHGTAAVLLPLAVLYGVDQQLRKAMDYVQQVMDHPEATEEQRRYAYLLREEYSTYSTQQSEIAEHSEGM